MSLHWFTIFFVLTHFILINSDEITANITNAGNRRWINGDMVDVNHSNEGSGLLSKADNSELPMKEEIIPTALNLKRTKKQHNETEEISKKKRKYQQLIAALSKISKVQLSEENSTTAGRTLMENIKIAAQRKNDSLQDTGLTRFNTKLLSNSTLDDSSNNGIKQKKFHCQAIQDILIPEVNQYVPSYSCKSGSERFILSSKRFFEDRRSNLNINLDEDTLRKLKNPATTLRDNQLKIISAILVLSAHEDYDIRYHQNITLHEQQIVNNKSVE